MELYRLGLGDGTLEARASLRIVQAHDMRHVLAIHREHVGDGIPTGKKRGDDGARAGAVDQIKGFGDPTAGVLLNFVEDADGVEALGAPSIQREDSKEFLVNHE